MNVQTTIEYGSRNVATGIFLQRFSFPQLYKYIKGGIFIYIDIIDKVKWQAGQGGTHLAILHKIPSRDFCQICLLGSIPNPH